MPKRRRSVVAMAVKRSSRVALVSEHIDDDEPFATYLDKLLTLAGLGNTDVERLTGVDNRTIQKWRRGIVKPAIPLLRQFADGMEMPRSLLYIRAGVLEPDDIDLDPLYAELAEITAQMPEDRRDVMRSHIRLLIRGAEAELAADADQGAEVADQPGKKAG